MRCDFDAQGFEIDVSIHAPARGAIKIKNKKSLPSVVSIHAPARGAISRLSPFLKNSSFNSRTRKGCDDYAQQQAYDCDVSIHAPARGAMSPLLSCSRGFRFNSRTRKGCDKIGLFHPASFKFQFTHPQGVRLFEILCHCRIVVSIHAPARGAIRPVFRTRSAACFNSRTRKGCDLPVFHDLRDKWFQFTHPQGVRSRL